MDKNIAIEFDGVGKQYRLGLVGTGSLQHDINRWWQTTVLGKEDPYLKIGEVNDRSTKGHSDYVWALKDISFKVEQGDVVGIIGKNGAGKSTLLKLLSHITAPSTGHITYRGRIASLLEVGTGFHPEMTARENIYMNGSIMGMTKHEIDRKLDEIIDFAGVERYIDTPVKRFSSGMTVRLGFAVAAFLEPEILVIDEVLAVGDAEFQKKALGKMKDISSGKGRTVLFVSHNMAAVRSLCKKGIVLKNGLLEFMGTSDECVDHYVSNNNNSLIEHTIIKPEHRKTIYARPIEIMEVMMCNDVTNISTSEPLKIKIKLKQNSLAAKRFKIGLFISNQYDVTVGTAYTNQIEIDNSKEYWVVSVELKNHNLAKGRYSVNINMSNFDYTSFGKDLDIVRNVLVFEVKSVGLNPKKEFVAWHKNLGGCAFQDATLKIENHESEL